MVAAAAALGRARLPKKASQRQWVSSGAVVASGGSGSASPAASRTPADACPCRCLRGHHLGRVLQAGRSPVEARARMQHASCLSMEVSDCQLLLQMASAKQTNTNPGMLLLTFR